MSDDEFTESDEVEYVPRMRITTWSPAGFVSLDVPYGPLLDALIEFMTENRDQVYSHLAEAHPEDFARMMAMDVTIDPDEIERQVAAFRDSMAEVPETQEPNA